MQTFTEIVAAVVVSSSAAAYSHFGVTLDARRSKSLFRRSARSRAPAARSLRLPPSVIAKSGKGPTLVREICPETRAKLLRTWGRSRPCRSVLCLRGRSPVILRTWAQ